jgi:integrase
MADVTHLKLVAESDMAKRRRTYGKGTVYLRGKTYWLSYYLPSGERIQKSAKTRDKEAAEHLLMEDLVQVGKGDTDHLKPWMFGDTAKAWLRHDVIGSGKYGVSTINSWRIIVENHLLPVFEDDTLHYLQSNPTVLKNYISAKLTGKSPVTGKPLQVEGQAFTKLAPATVHQHITALGMIFDFARAENRMAGSSDPMARVARPKLNRRETVKAFEADQVAALQGALKTPEDRFLAFVLTHLGLRVGEAMGLYVSDFNPKTKKLMVARTVKCNAGRYYLDDLGDATKTEAGQRELTLGDEMVKRFEAHIAEMRKLKRTPKRGPGLIFPNQVGKLKSPNNWRERTWNKALKRAKIFDPEAPIGRKPTPHWLRHTYASRHIAEGTPVSTIAYCMGHAGPEITLRIYAHIFDAQRSAIADTVGFYDEDEQQAA